MKKYRTDVGPYSVSSKKIVAVEVERESDASVWINGRRVSRVTDYNQYHDTWEAAHKYLLERASRFVAKSRSNLARDERIFAAIEALKEG